MKGIGVDIVEFSRIKRVGNLEKFVDKILSEKEKNMCNPNKLIASQLETNFL